MNFLNKYTFTLLLLIVLAFFNSVFAAGPPGPPAGGSGPPCWPPPCIPIDGGITFLIIAGLAYGGKKTYDFSKNKD